MERIVVGSTGLCGFAMSFLLDEMKARVFSISKV